MNARPLGVYNLASFAMKPMHGSYQGDPSLALSTGTGRTTGALGGGVPSDAFTPTDTANQNSTYTRRSFISSTKKTAVPTNIVQNPHLFGGPTSPIGTAVPNSVPQSKGVSTSGDVPPPRKEFSVKVSDMASLTAKLSKKKNGASDFRDIENAMGVRFDESKDSKTNMGGAMFHVSEMKQLFDRLPAWSLQSQRPADGDRGKHLEGLMNKALGEAVRVRKENPSMPFKTVQNMAMDAIDKQAKVIMAKEYPGASQVSPGKISTPATVITNPPKSSLNGPGDVPPPRKQMSVGVSDMAALTAKLSKEKNGASDFRDIENAMGVRFDESKDSKTNMGGAMFHASEMKQLFDRLPAWSIQSQSPTVGDRGKHLEGLMNKALGEAARVRKENPSMPFQTVQNMAMDAIEKEATLLRTRGG